MVKLRNGKTAEYVLLTAFFFFMVLIFHWSPLAGDDWIYASEVRYSGVIEQTVYAYMTWSGRVLSEFWGFVFTIRKLLWEISGPALMVMSAVMIVRLRKHHTFAETALAVFLILTVPMFIRTQTITFVVGYAAYFIPVPLYFLLLVLLKRYLLEGVRSAHAEVLMCVLSFVIPLHMENMSVLLAFTCFAAFAYAFLMKKDLRFPFILLMCAGVSCVIMFFAPGTAVRLNEDFSETSALNAARILANWKPFLHLSLYYADAVHTVLCPLLIAGHFLKKRTREDLFLIAVFALHLILTWTDGFRSIVFDTVWFFLFYGALLRSAWRKRSPYREILMFLAAGALVSDLIMVLSPSFPERTSVYAVFCMIAFTSVIFGDLDLSLKEHPAAKAALCLGILAAGAHWYRIYYSVHLVNIVRQAQIEYYQKRPDAGEAWFLAYPKGSVHSANIDTDEDVSHIRGFKDYYYLSDDLHLNYYYIDAYDKISVMGEMPEEK